ncbi:family 16 glycosylhydrolase [Puniceicoccales bacterium CK1056]|uniref:Family 16 glycosylhydrolase n=1 Tax=Oceanipulchritudo coccoides TaxID=2706888 RepID=A0A6B2M0D4_9BACT|nr:family 16 glycosylhydrolase [Oceanipulchritudo coccoides]NDV61210.1 family 16 glycosylhydrolase [Oceanipulchritudo coccoides]
MKAPPPSLFFRLLAGLGLFLIAQSPLMVSAGWTLVWQDEFTQANGSPPDPSKWGYDIGGWGWGNGEEQYYTDSTDNARIENNQLVIEMRDDTGTNGNPDDYFGNDYTSARLLTKGKFDQLYGKFEARIKVPEGGDGLWPAFWMLGADFPNTAWPFCGEIDIMEYVSRQPNEIFGTIHGPGYSGGSAYGQIVNIGEAVVNDYHIFAVEWEPDEIRWYFDGVLYHTANPADVAPNDWVFNESNPPQATDGFFMILNMAIGGNFGGAIDANNINFPTQMLVDYVRVYEQTVTNPQLVLTKTGTFNDESGDGFADPGETIDYTFTIENTGDVELTNVTVTDPLVTVSGGTAPSPNLLLNPGFEVTQAGSGLNLWDMVPSGGNVVVTDAYAYPNTGLKSLLIDSTGAGDWASPNASQSFTATAGEEFNFKGYMYSHTGVSGASFGLLKIEFRNSLGDLLDPGVSGVSIGSAAASPFFGAESNVFLNNASPAATWILTEVQAVAPPGTATVGFYLLNVNEPGATQLMYFDDIKATDVTAGTGPTLPVGATDSSTYTATYTITQADIDAGQFVNTATANSAEGASDDDTETTILPTVPPLQELTLTKTGTFNDESGDGFADPGETISYAFSIENTGSVPLTNIVVTDPLVTVLGTPTGPTNLLTNGSFNTAIGAEWTQNLSGGSAGNSSAYVRTGANSLVIDSTGAGDWASPNLSQTFPASPGQEFNLQGYMLAPAGSIPGTSFGLLKIEFTNALGEALDPASVSIGGSADAPFFGAESTPFLNSVSAIGDWIPTETQAVAPAGTVSVRFVALNVNQPGNPGPMYFDDIVATDVAAGGGQVDLLVGATDSTTYTGTYTITQADIDAGGVTNTATASSDEGVSDDDVEVTLLPQNFQFTISTTPVFNDESGDGFAEVGETVSYPFTVENTGNVTLNDFEIVMISLTGGPTTLDVGEVDTTTFEGTYSLTESDIQAGAVAGLTAIGYGSNVGTMEQPLPSVPLTEDPNGDFDGDGILNILERAFVLNMFSPDPIALPAVGTYDEDGQKYMTISYTRQNITVIGDSNGTFTSSDFIYTVEVSDDLTTWNSDIPELELVNEFDSGVSESAIVRSTDPMVPGTTKFMRLKVEPRP